MALTCRAAPVASMVGIVGGIELTHLTGDEVGVGVILAFVETEPSESCRQRHIVSCTAASSSCRTAVQNDLASRTVARSDRISEIG